MKSCRGKKKKKSLSIELIDRLARWTGNHQDKAQLEVFGLEFEILLIIYQDKVRKKRARAERVNRDRPFGLFIFSIFSLTEKGKKPIVIWKSS